MSGSRTPPYLAKQPSFFAESSPPLETRSACSISVPSPPSHRGAHRDGFSIEKCRDVLVRHCGRIPRNYTFKDGIHRVYWILREYLGDENMDLAIAQLYELIELPSAWTDDEGAAFQSWKHDYMLKNKDFENPHVPRLGNIIVAPIKPSERLQKWREEQSDHDTAKLSSSQSSQTTPSISKANSFGPGFGRRPRGHGGWRVDMALFVSNKAEGTRVLHCPTPQELHKRTWDEDFGRGGRLIQERTIVPGDPIDPINVGDLDDPVPQETPSYRRKKSLTDFGSTKPFPTKPSISSTRSITLRIPIIIRNALASGRPAGIQHRLSKNDIPENESWRPQYSQFPDPLFGRYPTDVKAYESNKAVRELPHPYTDAGKTYYRNIKTQSLDPALAAPNPAFARKHGLIAQAIPLHKGIDCKLMPTAEDIAIQQGFREHEESVIQTSVKCFKGPFTADMFKDSGIDFPIRWTTTEDLLSPNDGHGDVVSDMGALVDGAQSPSKNVQCTSRCLYKHEALPPCPIHDSARARRDADNATNQSCSNLAQESPVFFRHAIELRGGAGRKCRWRGIFTGRLTSNTRRRSVTRYERHADESRPQSGFTQKSTQGIPEIYAENLLRDLSSNLRRRISSKLVKGYPFSFLIRASRAIPPQSAMSKKEGIQPSRPISTEPHGEKILAAVSDPKGLSTIISCKSRASAEQAQTFGGRFSTRLGPSASQTRSTTSFKSHMDPCVEKPAIQTNTPRSTSDVCRSPKLILEVRPVHETLTKLSRGIEDSHAEMLILPMRVSLESHWESRGNNKQQFAGVSNETECEHSKVSTEKLSSFSETSNHTRKSSFPLDYEALNEPAMAYFPIEPKMDLNRELPPLPVLNSIIPLHIRKKSEEKQQMKSFEEPEPEPERLLPLCYNPVRDGLKYRGIQYHPEGIRYWPEVSQHQLHTSPMPMVDTYAEARAAVKSAAIIFEGHHEVSTGIMGNFMPLAPPGQSIYSGTESARVPLTRNKLGKPTPQRINSTSEDPTNYVVTAFHESTAKTDKGVEQNMRLELENRNNSTLAILRSGADVCMNPQSEVDNVHLEDGFLPYTQHLKKKSPVDFAEQHSVNGCVSGYQAGSTYQVTDLLKNLDNDTSEAMEKYADDDTFVDIEESGHQKIKHFKNLFDDYQELGGGNPFEYEGEIHEKTLDRMTTFTDFISEAETQEPRKPPTFKNLGHIKNSHSESNALYMAKQPASILIHTPRPLGCSRQRSDSSPSASQMRQQQDIVPNYNGSSRSEDERHCFSSTHQRHPEYDPNASPSRGRGLRSPVKHLADVLEKDENIPEQPLAVPKRSRSPLKKMFGEGGWLSNAMGPKEEMSNQKRHGLMDKIKIKMEEIGLKAEISPTKHAIKAKDEKRSVLSTFPVSLNPAQQADVYSDVELLICNAANTFLMHQYQNCRMSVDSLKKVTDFWRGKGRPQVMEFHYDQSTQRDLIVANQKNFRFFGPNANDPLRVNAMLYAWKNDAREMSIRTFCYPDSLIRNHIRDSFMILDFLGGHPAQYLTLYEVRAKFTCWVEEAQQLLAASCSAGSWAEKGGMTSHGSFPGQVTDNHLHSLSTSRDRQSTSTTSNPKRSLGGSSAQGVDDEASDPYKSLSHQLPSKASLRVSTDDIRGS